MRHERLEEMEKKKKMTMSRMTSKKINNTIKKKKHA